MQKLISHPAENGVAEKLLFEHLNNVAQKSADEINKRNLKPSIISKEKLERLSFLIGIFHDFGKATTFFQKYIRNDTKPSNLTNHSLVSAIICFYIVKEEFVSDEWAYVAFHVIYRHHGNLTSFDLSNNSINFGVFNDQLNNILNNHFDELSDFYNKFHININCIKEIKLDNFKNFIKESDGLVEDIAEEPEKAIERFFIINYLFSLLIDNDKQDAARLDNDYFEANIYETVNNVFAYIDQCRKNDPEKFNPEIPINRIRNQFLEEVEGNESISEDNHFYTITAPTGIGKTFGCLAFANSLKEKLPSGSGRIIYCLPYTSIIDQNFIEFEKIIRFNKKMKYDNRPSRYLLKHHYLTPKEVKKRINEEERTYKDYLDDQLLIESWQSCMIVTTFVQLFHTLIGNRNRFLKKLHNIVNSIIILDEVQNIDPEYYNLIKSSFEILGNRFNIYFLLITATQPEILDKNHTVQLVDPSKYMKSDLFNRVHLHIDLKNNDIDVFISQFCDSFDENNCLVVMNTKKYAIKFYDKIKEHFSDYQIFCLTTNLTPYDRKNQINDIKNHLKNDDRLIVVSTQLIEAGVDVSFQNVYRDFGPLDSIIQVAGRCNRNGEYGILGGNMKLINLENYKIYKNILKQYVDETISENEYESKDFYELSKIYFEQFNFKAKAEKLLSAIYELNYDTKVKGYIPVSDFSLIDEKPKANIFILRTENAQENMDNLLELKEELKESNLSKKEKDDVLVQIEKLKNGLKEFQISVYNNELIPYENIIQPRGETEEHENFPYRYISYEDHLKYSYDDKIGLLKEPKEKIPNVLFY